VKIAIVGSRNFAPLRWVSFYVDVHTRMTDTIISGGAVGVDAEAVRTAKARGQPFIVIRPDWNKYGKAAGMMRNTQIVDQCDKLVAFWDGKSKGTLDSIMKAAKAGKHVEINPK
jgi:hypothetical protein